MNFYYLLLVLCAAHAAMDEPLQTDRIRQAKRGMIEGYPWWLGMGYHAVMHAGAVAFITQNAYLGAAELVFHFCIDRAKCRGKVGNLADQILHLLCKVAWAASAASLSVFR